MEIDPIITRIQGLSQEFGQGEIRRISNKEIDISNLSRGGGQFADFIKDAVNSVDQAQKTAAQKTEDLVTGRSDNIHEVMISMEQAQLSFQLMLEIRNKMVETYQELSRMQM